MGPKLVFQLLLPFLINSLEVSRNAMGHLPSQAGLPDLWVQIKVELPAHPGHLLSDTATFGLYVWFL